MLFQLYELYAVSMLAQQCYPFPGIQKLKNNLIIQDVLEYIFASTLNKLVVKITGL